MTVQPSKSLMRQTVKKWESIAVGEVHDTGIVWPADARCDICRTSGTDVAAKMNLLNIVATFNKCGLCRRWS